MLGTLIYILYYEAILGGNMLGFDCSRLNAIARGEYIRKHVQELKICDERKVQTEVEKNNQPKSVKSCISASHDLT